MVTIVLALAIANLGLGFALALALDRFPVCWMRPFGLANAGSPLNAEDSGSDAGATTKVPNDDPPRAFLDAEVEPKSIIEALLWVVKLATLARRAKFVELDRAFFDPQISQPISSELKQELEAFHQLVESWITEAEAEEEHAGQLCQALVDLLLDQSSQLRACIDGLADASRDEVARHLATAMNAVNLLRDRADTLLCQLLTSEGRVHSVADRYRALGERNTLTHLGLAALFDEWWADDPDHVRLVSVVMLDVNQFDPINRQVGTARGDVALLRLGDLLHDLVRKDRGFDRVARYSGQQFVVFLGDTSSRNAAKSAERFRQTIAATSFEALDQPFRLTASVAVIEVGKTEGAGEFMPRLEAALKASKKAGRNRGSAEAGGGPVAINFPQVQVHPGVIESDSALAT